VSSILALDDVSYAYRGARAGQYAVQGVSFAVDAGLSTGLVGESGSGKSTLIRLLLGLLRPSAGRVLFDGVQLDLGNRSQVRSFRRSVQTVFQDPYSSLDPRQSAEQVIDEVLRLHHAGSRAARAARVRSLVELVGLAARQARALPRALSGGQRQRIAIARALAAEPRVVILDESVAALDVSIQAQILNLLADIRRETGVSYILISHDLAVVRQITDEAIVMHRGRVVERGPTAQVLDAPRHDYTRLLRASVPRPGWKPQRRQRPDDQGAPA